MHEWTCERITINTWHDNNEYMTERTCEKMVINKWTNEWTNKRLNEMNEDKMNEVDEWTKPINEKTNRNHERTKIEVEVN